MSVSKPLPHDTAQGHVNGNARYVDDIPTPTNCLHLVFGQSPAAAGVIEDIDLSSVRTADGVIGVFTATDLPFANAISPSVHDEPLLAKGAVHYLGQPVFIVAAHSHLAARKAAKLANFKITETQAILSIEDAEKADSRFEDGPRVYQKGAAKDALSKAKNRLQGSVNLGGQEHFYLEGQVALALPGEDGAMVVHSSSQHPTEVQHKVAEAIGEPFNQVRVEVRRMGGGFGGKESQGNALAVACAIVAQKTGRPVKMRYDRDDDFVITGKRHDCRINYDVAYNDQGRILAIDFIHHIRCGWAQDLSLPVADRAMLHSDNAYHLDNIRITSHRWKTNTQSATAFRGFGGPQGMAGIEAVMGHIAHALGKDALDVRLANFYADHTQATKPQTTPYGMEVDDFILNGLVEKLSQSADYTARVSGIEAWNAKNPFLKKGIALTPVKFGISFTLTHLNQAGALVQIYSDGSVLVNHGGTEMGQGLFQKVAQVAATTLGVHRDAIRPSATDTAKVPNTSATAASSGSDLNGMAVKVACEKLVDRLRSFAADLGGVTPNDVLIRDGLVQAGTFSGPFADLVKKAYENRISLSATGFYKTPGIAWDRIAGQGRPFFYFAYGASISEVVIDTLTGENRILRTDILHDCGSSLNSAIDLGQIEGGFVQGAGWLTTEELVWDNQGRLRTHAPSTYKIPTCRDRPDIFNVDLWDAPNVHDTIYKSKAVGEPPFMHGISVWQALQHAVSFTGPNFPDLQAPATAEEVLNAIGRAQG